MLDIEEAGRSQRGEDCHARWATVKTPNTRRAEVDTFSKGLRRNTLAPQHNTWTSDKMHIRLKSDIGAHIPKSEGGILHASM